MTPDVLTVISDKKSTINALISANSHVTKLEI